MEFIENEVKEVGPGFWICVAVDNISWYDVGDGVAVIDSLEDPTQADVVRRLINETTGKDLKWIVNTHWDVDHIACNAQWRREGAVCIAHKSCAESAESDPSRPDVSFDDQAALRGLDDKVIQMQWMGGTHTPWDTVLYFPAARVLHIADLFGWGLIPCQPTPAKVARLREVLDKVVAYDADAVICGHGPVTTMEHLRRFQTYFEDMLTKVPALLKEGKTAEQIEGEVPPPGDMADWWRFTDWKHRKNIELIRDHYKTD